jgi:hypothetical protein
MGFPLADFGLRVVPAVVLADDDEVLPDDEVEPVSAYAGAATATTAPPRAARPNVARAAVLAMQFLITEFLLL